MRPRPWPLSTATEASRLFLAFARVAAILSGKTCSFRTCLPTRPWWICANFARWARSNFEVHSEERFVSFLIDWEEWRVFLFSIRVRRACLSNELLRSIENSSSVDRLFLKRKENAVVYIYDRVHRFLYTPDTHM